MQFDIAVGMREDLLNRMAKEVHPQLHPVLFNKTINLPDLLLRVTFDVPEAPVFDLIPLTQNQVRVIGEAARARAPERFTGVTADVLEALIHEVPTVSVKFRKIEVTMVSTLDNHETKLVFGATAFCRAGIDLEHARITLKVMHIDVANMTNEQIVFIIDHVVTPKIQELLDQYLGSLPVPPLNLGSVPLSTPLVVIKDSRIIALANVLPKGTPAFPTMSDWPDSEMFSLVSPDGLNAAATLALNLANPHFAGSETQSIDIKLAKFKAKWRYDVTLYDPKVTVDSPISLSLENRIRAGIHLEMDTLFGDPSVDLSVTIKVEPHLRATLDAAMDQNHRLILGVKQVEPFRLEVSIDQLPDWAKPATKWITGTVTGALTEAILRVLNPFLSQIRIPVYTIPEMEITAGPVHLYLVPARVSIYPLNGMLAMKGSFDVRVPADV
ncbi:MAG TPA: hypothetical protein VNT75_17125 [Symbiobacteriaceae bacterium]|nr:hypothetical protein [Symbiobacteriaceae bacterium]